MRISRGGWYVVYAILCIYVRSTIQIDVTDDDDDDDDDGGNDPEIDARQDFRGTSREEFPPEPVFERKLIPIKSPRMQKFVMLPLEPDAEILPAHYTSVKPPGVDHMEYKYAETQILEAIPTIQLSGKTDQSGGTINQTKRVVTIEKGQEGDDRKEKKKTRYTEAAGKKKTHFERDNDSKSEEKQAGGQAGSVYGRYNDDNVNRKAAGFRNVYHKDEYKKDHDFYDNDDHGGHSKKHGRYNEKHIAVEGTFKKGDNKGSRFDEAELRKEGTTKNSRAEQESKGHHARRGYDEFFKNFQGFVKHTG
ncbi:uncharacterized protein LOC143345100 [Colletes latitarsis]|uniref:uncharacterized protein LOC143345100 n=1 Tax=Colletes latitarsis TaxID=2605962 RepID=UPI004035907B